MTIAHAVDGSLLVRPSGSLDLRGASRLKRAVDEALSGGSSSVVVDLSAVTFMDSTALSVLVGLKRRLQPPRTLTLTGLSPTMDRLLQITGLEHAFGSPDAPAAASSTVPDRDAELAYVLSTPRATEDDDVQAHAGVAGDSGHLSRDAATALAIAASAMAFASTADDQAERWLRTLRRHGDAGVILGSLGICDESVDRGAAPMASASASPALPEADPVAAVSLRAEEIARDRGAGRTHSRDLLAAVRDTYGDAFERALARHATEPEDISAQLDHLLAAR